MRDDDPTKIFDDLETLQRQAVEWATDRRSARRIAKQGTHFIRVSTTWLDRAAVALAFNGRHLMVALWLYRLWCLKGRQPVVASNLELCRLGMGRQTKGRALRALQRAGLIEIYPAGHGQAPRVAIVPD